MAVDVEALQGEVAAHKKRAGDLSADLMRAQKALGAKDDELKKLGALEAENDQLAAENNDQKSQIKALEAALSSANKIAADNAAKIEAAEQIKKGLAAL